MAESPSFMLGTSDVLNVSDTLAFIKENKGATLIPMIVAGDELMFVSNAAPKVGYMVSVAGYGLGLFESEFTTTHVENYVRTHFMPYRDAFESSLSEVPFFGVWQSDAGMWYLDISICMTDRVRAVNLARSTGELAIWDNKNQCEISMHG